MTTVAFVLAIVLAGQAAGPSDGLSVFAIKHDGLSFKVMGAKNDRGFVVWNPESEFNRAAYEAAKRQAEPKLAPVAPPTPKLAEANGDIQNFGLDPTRISRTSTYIAPSPEAVAFIAGTDDSSMLHITIIGSTDERSPVIDDIKTNRAFDGIRDRLMVQGYDRGAWAVDDSLGFAATGKPTILIQSHKSKEDPEGGKVLYRASDYSMGATGLAEAIRKAKPSYDPKADPTPDSAPSSGGFCPLGFTKDHWPSIAAVGALLLFINLKPQRGK